MKIATVLGSPRARGNTATVLGLFEELMARDYTIDRINITSYKVNGCMGCNKCADSYDSPGCIQNDDCMEIYDRIIAADAIVYATPLYWFGFSAQMKPLIDRHVCLLKGIDTPQFKSFLSDRPVALLVTCDGPVKDNTEAIQIVFDKMSEYCNTKIVGKYIVADLINEGELAKQAPLTARAMADDIGKYLTGCPCEY